MTNNDELALKLKAAADKAVDNFDPNMFILTRDMVALLAERDADKKRIAEFQRQEHYRTRQAVIDVLAASGECWDDIKEYMDKWDAEADRIKLEVGE